MIPSVSTDRIFLMKITGQTSINKLDDYILLQKAQGHSIKGRYTLFLKQIEQSNSLGQTFNNYVLDILKNEDLKSTQPIPEKAESQKKLSTKNAQNVNNNVVKQEKTIITEQVTTSAKEETKVKNNKTSSKKDSKKVEEKIPENSKNEKSEGIDDELKDCYALLQTFTDTLVNKKGESKEYLIGEFADMKDQISNIVIRPEDADELSKCDLGTYVKLDVSEIGGKKFAMKLEYIEKTLKKVAA